MRIFLAYAVQDLQIASTVSSALRELGYEVVRAETFLEPGDDIEARIKAELERSDALLILWSRHGAKSGNLIMELGFFLGVSGSKPLLPVILDDSEPPPSLASRSYFRVQGKDPEDIALRIAEALSKLEGAAKQAKRNAEARKQEVERSAGAYIEQSLAALTVRERRYQRWAIGCYVLGYLTLVGGLAYALYRLVDASPTFTDVPQALYVSVLTITAIGFLAAASKFAFVLGRSFMVEALRNHDRTHAIKFGEFYLKAYGEHAVWSDLKEAFQHWNLDSGSTFKDQKEESVDPQVLKALMELLRNVKG